MNKRKIVKLALAAAVVTLGASHAHAADYSDVSAAVTAVTGIPAQVSTAFLGGATIGVGILILRLVGKGLKKGLGLA